MAGEGQRSLLRSEAEERAARLRVASVQVELDLGDATGATFTSRSTVTFSCRDPEPGGETFADFRGESLLAATLNGVALREGAWQQGRLRLTGLQRDNVLVVEGVMTFSSDGEGLHRHFDPEDHQPYLYAMSFLDAAPRWFACFDQPDLKAHYELHVTAPPAWTVIGNGSSEALGEGRWRIAPPEPLSTYFVTLVAGPYASVYGEHDGIRLGFHVRGALADQLRAEVADLQTVTAQCFDYYHQLFGTRYPFGEYHQAFVPDFNAGAMENPGCVTFRDQFIYRGRATRAERGRRAGVVAHEMAHQWFGDLVTMRWWDDLWLNESFAEYLAHRCCAAATAYDDLWTEFGVVRKDWGSVADQSPSTHPIAGNGAPDATAALQNFDGISYAKGAAVLQQLAAYLGEEVFLGGLRDYMRAFAFGNATFADLMAAWTAAGAEGLEAWAEAWLLTTGMDTLDMAGLPPELTVAAHPPPGQAPRPHAVSVGAVSADGKVLARTPVTLLGGSAVVPVPTGTVLVVPDVDDLTWAKVRFGPHGWSDVAAVAPNLRDQTAVVVVTNALRDAVRDGSLDPAAALDLVCTLVPEQPHELVCSQLLIFAQDSLAGPYSHADERFARRARVAATAEALLAGSEPGSDRQLVAFKLVVRSAVDPLRLLPWRSGQALPPGLELDPELTWSVVERLAGLVDRPELLTAALAEDPSASGRVHAARARAATPTAAAKAAAWQLIMNPSELSAYELYATASGFFVPGQEALTAPYVWRYFDEIAATARFRSGWSLDQVAGLAYPGQSSTQETLSAAEATLATDLVAPLRRALVDGTDRLRRAVTSLQRY